MAISVADTGCKSEALGPNGSKVIRIIDADAMLVSSPVLRLTPAWTVATAVVVATLVFLGVQDHVTGLGAGQYVALQRAAIEGRGPAVTVDSVMDPWVGKSVRQGLAWSALPLGVGLAAAAVQARRAHRA